MILPKPEVQAILKGAREIRFPSDYAHPVEEGTDEVAPVRTARGREPVCWVIVEGWGFDDDTDEYVIELRRCPAPDVPRLLLPAGRSPSRTEIGYTDIPGLAMRGNSDPGEAVDQTTQDKFTKEGWAGYNQRERHRLIDRRMLAIEERLKLAWGDGKRMGLDLSDNLRAIDRIVGSMERKTDQSRPAA